jgi:hypothetical protein
MRLTRGLKKLRALLPRGATDKPEVDEAERVYRYIFRYLTIGTDKRYLPRRGRPNAIVLQMGKVASTSIQAALRERGINAFHSHGLSDAQQHARLSQLLQEELDIPLVGGEVQRHILNVGLQLLARWYRQNKRRGGARLKVVTLTRDPVTHYPSSFIQRRKFVRAGVAAWQRQRLGLPAGSTVDEAEAVGDLVQELASIIAECRLSEGPAAYDRCIARAQERWPGHPVVAQEIGAWIGPLVWFDRQATPLFGIDLLAAPEFRDRGWAEWSNDWAEILVLRYEDLASLVPELRRFFALPELALPRKNVSSSKRGATSVIRAIQSALATQAGQACAREVRLTPYGRACGYDRLAQS